MPRSREREIGKTARELDAALLHAEEDERRRLARVLHDELGQTLAAARLVICSLRDSEASEDKARHLQDLQTMIERSIAVTRSLTFRLSPPILYELGLEAALQALAERTAAESGLDLDFVTGEGWSPPPEEIAVVVYRVVRELLHNVTKHARAQRVRLELGGGRHEFRIVLEDDGVGFDATAAGRGVGDPGLGLFHVRERMGRLGGRFELDSVPGRGTRALLKLPTGRGGSS